MMTQAQKDYLKAKYCTPDRRTVRECWWMLTQSLPAPHPQYDEALRFIVSLPVGAVNPTRYPEYYAGAAV